MKGFKNIVIKTFVQVKSDLTFVPVGSFIFLEESHNDNLLECTGQKIEELKEYPELYQILLENGINKLPDWRNNDNRTVSEV